MREAVLEHGKTVENKMIDWENEESWSLYDEDSDFDWLYNPATTADCFSLCYDMDCNTLMWYVPKGAGEFGEYDLICEAARLADDVPDHLWTDFDEDMNDHVLTSFGFYA